MNDVCFEEVKRRRNLSCHGIPRLFVPFLNNRPENFSNFERKNNKKVFQIIFWTYFRRINKTLIPTNSIRIFNIYRSSIIIRSNLFVYPRQANIERFIFLPVINDPSVL